MAEQNNQNVNPANGQDVAAKKAADEAAKVKAEADAKAEAEEAEKVKAEEAKKAEAEKKAAEEAKNAVVKGSTKYFARASNVHIGDRTIRMGDEFIVDEKEATKYKKALAALVSMNKIRKV